MTNIKLTQNAGGHNAGDTITTTPRAADYLVSEGYAEVVEDGPKGKGRAPKTTPESEGVGGDSAPQIAKTVG